MLLSLFALIFSLSSSERSVASMATSTSPGGTPLNTTTDENENNSKNSISTSSNVSTSGPSQLTFDQIRNDYKLTDEVLRNASSLEAVIDQFDTDVARKSLNFNFTLVTDGQLHIRQCLFPEAQRKNIKLPSYYYTFHDLRKEFMAARPNSSIMTIKDMLNGK